ncbi:protein phosphatase 1 (formerly 2C)-like protein [Aphelenchoides avenae]|nr:protein phosphatase 1 (formerly 2C)-like protein [Aphelenchus avenae]
MDDRLFLSAPDATFLASTLSNLRLLTAVLFRVETFVAFFLVLGIHSYVRWLITYHQPLLKAQRLASKDMMHSVKLEPPKFIDIGFINLKAAEKTWRLKHKNFAFYADQGLRDYMEDRMHYLHDPTHRNLSIFSIFDGHGGNFVSEYLERNFSKMIRDRLVYGIPQRKLSIFDITGSDEFIRQAIVTEVHKIDDQISRLDPALTSSTGSTLISAILEHNRYLTVVNVGDSRAVACDLEGKARPLSFDHKPSDINERRRIENAGGFVEKYGVDRVQGVLAVSRAFGDTSLKRAQVLTAHPDVVRVDLSREPLKYVIVASDGFWDVFGNDEAVHVANEFLETKPSAKWPQVANHLVNEALQRDSQDNVSLLFVRLSSH